MKHVKPLLAVALLIGVMAFAQRDGHRGPRGNQFNDLSVEQLATLKTKKMTLALDLTEKQQQQIMELNLENAAFRKGKMQELEKRKESGELKKPTTEERYVLETERLDRMIARQETMKKILNEDQYEQWKKMQLHRHAHAHGHKKMKRQSRRG